MRCIYFGKDHILSFGDTNNACLHKHLAKHISVSLEAPLKFFIGNDKILCNGIVINSNVMHAAKCFSQKHIVFMFEESSNIAEEIDRKYLHASDYCLLNQNVIDNIKREFNLQCLTANRDEYNKTFYKLLNLLGLNNNIPCVTDARIIQILNILDTKEEINNNIIKEILDLINISQSRLSHLFKEQVGIALNSYLVMIKLKKAYKYLIEGNNITNAALKAGFDSSSHFAATSKNLLGISAQKISRECRFIIV